MEHAATLALVEGQWKYIEPNNGPKFAVKTATELGNDTAPQLNNLKSDIGETTNPAARHPERVRRMAAILDAIRTRAPN